MKSPTRCLGLAAVAAFILASNPVLAQKSSGVLKIQHMYTPPSASIHEEATFSVVMPFASGNAFDLSMTKRCARALTASPSTTDQR